MIDEELEVFPISVGITILLSIDKAAPSPVPGPKKSILLLKDFPKAQKKYHDSNGLIPVNSIEGFIKGA